MNRSSNILLASRPSEVFTSFRGPLKSFPVVKFVDRNKGILRRWIVFSQGKRSVLVQYLFGKLLWDELNSQEREIFWYLHEVTSDITIFLSIKALNEGVSKNLLRRRLENSPFPELKFISRQKYLTLKGRINFILTEEEINLRRVPKYSGYSRHHTDKGSLGIEREDYLSEILDPYENVNEAVLLTYLTVGSISLFGGEYSYPDDRFQKEPKR